MSGAEVVAGLFLGVLPLVISAIEHYDDVLRPFVSYRNFTSKAQKIYDELETEKTIFRTECQLLLSTVVEQSTVSRMLDNVDHSSWTDKVVRQRFARKLGPLGAACSSIVLKIKNQLCEIEKKCEEFSPVILIPKEGVIFGNKIWRHRAGKKLKFAFSESGLLNSIVELGRFNRTFLTIANQIIRLDRPVASPVDSKIQEPISEMSQQIEKFRIMQRASRQLYEALSQTCRVHTEHMALLCMDTKYAKPNGTSRFAEIQFKLSFTHEVSGTSPVYTSHKNDDRPNPVPLSFTQGEDQNEVLRSMDTNQQEIHPVTSPTRKPPKLSVCNISRFDIKTIIIREVSSSQIGPHQNVLSSENVNQISNFLGILEETESCRLIVLSPTTSIPRRPSKEAMSLTQLVVRESGKQPLGGMPQYQRLRLAKYLALAILKFHATPWLGENLQSKDVMFNDSTIASSDFAETCMLPYLHAVVVPPKSEGVSVYDGEGSRSSLSRMSVAPNTLLFNLGVMLLELAYGAPFNTLRQPEDAAASPDNGLADFVTARRLADSVGMSLGSTFASIIRKCLRCDFGCGEDLGGPELQSRLYSDVVCKLKTLEDGFRKLQIGV